MIKGKKGAGSTLETVVKFIIIIIVFAVLAYTLARLIGRVSESSLDLLDKKYQEFNYYDGTYYHPDLPDDLLNFFEKGFKGVIEEAKFSECSSCLGSFYIDQQTDMQDARIRFLQTATGIRLMLEDGKGVAGALDDTIFNNRDEAEWKLCIINPEKTDDLLEKVKNSLSSASSLDIPDSYITEIYDLTINFEGNFKKKDINAEYFTETTRDEADEPPQEIPYQAYLAGDERGWGLDLLADDKIDRYHFMFVMSRSADSKTHSFCILPTKRKGKKETAFDVKKFKELLCDFGKEFQPESLDSVPAMCPVPGGSDYKREGEGKESELTKPVSTSIFNGHLSCYYYGCYDIHEINKNYCTELFSECKGLCYRLYAAESKPKCRSCNEIKKCKDYKAHVAGINANTQRTIEMCNTDMCELGCRYDYEEEKCVEE